MLIINLMVILFSQFITSNFSLEIVGNNFFSTSFLTSKRKNPGNQEEVEKLIENILNLYNNAGFAFCSITPEISDSNNTIKKIILKIEEGERIIISDYIFKIQGKTAPGPIKKIARLKTGNYFSLKELTNSKRLILKTGVFSRIEENIIAKEGKYYLLFDLTENRSDYFVGTGSLAEKSFNFGLSFYSLNILGTLRRFQFQYEYNRLFSLQYTEPILLAPVSIGADFSLWTYDTARLGQLTGKITAPLGDYFSASLMSGIETVSYRDTVQTGYSKSLLGLGFGLNYETKDWSTTQKINFEYLFRHNDRLKIMYDGVLIWANFVISPHHRWVKTSGFEYFDYFRIGGSKDIRGYLEEEFTTTNVVWLNIEYKKFLIYPVLDIAFIEGEMLSCYGFGMDAKTNFAEASLIFAWPKQGGWRDGKVHLLFEKGL